MSEQEDLLPKEMLAMLVVAREEFSPGEKDVARVRSSLSTALLVQSGGAALSRGEALRPPSSALGASGGLATGVKLVLLGLGIGVGASVGSKLLSQPEEQAHSLSQPSSSEASPAQLSEPALRAEPSEAAPVGELQPSPSERTVPVPSAPPPTGTAPSNQSGPAKVSEMPAELAFVTRARRAVNRGEGALALGILRELDEKYPGGMLVEERRATEILAHCVNQDRTRAEVLARRFHATWPNSVYGDRVAQSCAGKE